MIGAEGLTRDDVLDNITFYWLTRTGHQQAHLGAPDAERAGQGAARLLPGPSPRMASKSVIYLEKLIQAVQPTRRQKLRHALNGKLRYRLPVRTAIALASAGAMA